MLEAKKGVMHFEDEGKTHKLKNKDDPEKQEKGRTLRVPEPPRL